MKKGIFLSFFAGILLLLSVSLFSQTVNQDESQDKDLKFAKGRKVSCGQGVMSLKSRAVEFSKEDFALNLSKYQRTKSIYFKLNESISKAVMQKLKNQGINIKSFVSDNTYIAEVNSEKLNALKDMNFIHGFAEIDVADKMSERIYKKNFSNHAKDGNYVKVIVSFFEDVAYNDAVNLVRSSGGIVESEKFSRTHKLVVSIHPDSLTALSEIDVIKYIDEVSPPPKTNNIDAGKLSEVFWGNTTGLFANPYNLTGLNINVAVKDGSYIHNHPDFGDRIIIVDEDPRSPTDPYKIAEIQHATHVSGTIGGALDLQDNVGGMAENVTIYSYNFRYNGNPPQAEGVDFTVDYVSAISNSASIINNSWGAVIGWDGGVGREHRIVYLEIIQAPLKTWTILSMII